MNYHQTESINTCPFKKPVVLKQSNEKVWACWGEVWVLWCILIYPEELGCSLMIVVLCVKEQTKPPGTEEEASEMVFP